MYIFEQLIETTDQAINIIKIKTAELESAQTAIDDAKAYLRAKGVEYVGVKSDPDLDMNDPKNWQTGDILVCIREDASDEFFRWEENTLC